MRHSTVKVPFQSPEKTGRGGRLPFEARGSGEARLDVAVDGLDDLLGRFRALHRSFFLLAFHFGLVVDHLLLVLAALLVGLAADTLRARGQRPPVDEIVQFQGFHEESSL